MYKTLLVGGCARSGTTAFRRWLNSSPWFYIGDERYTKRAYNSDTFNLDLFKTARFLDVQEGDSAVPQNYIKDDVKRIAKTVEIGGVIGDKIPRLADIKDLSSLDSSEFKFIIIVRNLFDVASSYKARAAQADMWQPTRGPMQAIEEWNRAVRWAYEQTKNQNAFIIQYEQFFFGSEEPSDLFDFLNVPSDFVPGLNNTLKSIRDESEKLEEMRRNILSPTERVEICRQGMFEVYRMIFDD